MNYELIAEYLKQIDLAENEHSPWRRRDYADGLVDILRDIFTDDELIELAKAKADGRLVVLPCKVGDVVYVASGCLFYRDETPYTPCEVVVFKQGKQRGVMMHLRPLCEEAAGTRYHRWFPVTSIGKTVFLTREDAEKALGGAEDGK